MTNIARFDPFAELVRYDPFRDLESVFRFPRPVARNLPEVPEMRMDVVEDEKGEERVHSEEELKESGYRVS